MKQKEKEWGDNEASSSSNVINQLQILIRTQAGLSSSFTSSSHHPPPPPSVVGLPDLVCHACQRELLRGPDSIICVYCGLAPLHTPPPHDLSFPSTLGFRWFLRALSLHTSETVEQQVLRGNESSRGRTSVEDENLLCELFDLKLKWPDDSSRFGVEIGSGRSLQLVGIDFRDNLPTEGCRDLAGISSNEEVLASGIYETEEASTFRGNNSLSLFESAQSRSVEGEKDESSDWAAEFQSVNADGDSNQASHINSALDPFNQDKSAGIIGSYALSTSNIESVSAMISDSKHSETNISAKVGEKGFELLDDSSFSWLRDSDQHQKSDNGYSAHDEKRNGDNSFDHRDDSRIFTGVENNQAKLSNTICGTESGGLDLSDSWNNFARSDETGSNKLHDEWDAAEWPHGRGDDVLWGVHVGLAPPEVHVDSKQNMPNQAESFPVEVVASKNVDNYLNLWNDFQSYEHDNQNQSTAPESADKIMPDKRNNASHAHAVIDVDSNLLQAGSSEAAGSMINGDKDNSSGLWNGNALGAWSDFAGSGDVSICNPTSNDTSFGEWGDFSTLMVTSMNQPQSSETNSAGNEAALNIDGEHNLWSHFSGSGQQLGNSFSGPFVSGPNPDSVSTGKATDSLTLAVDNKPHNPWGDFGWSTSILEQQSHSGGGKQQENKSNSEDHDLFSAFHDSDNLSTGSSSKQPKSNRVTLLDDKSSSGHDDAWGDFTSSSSNLFSSNANAAVQEVSERDALGVWDIIAASPSMQAGKETELPMGDSSGIYLLSSSMSSKDIGSDSSFHSDPLMGMLTAKNGSAQVAFPQTEVPSFVRMEDGGSKAGDFEQNDNIENVSQESLDVKTPVIETLISEMHDLSFMLESSLSIPKSGA